MDDDPSMHDVPRTCERWIWKAAENRRCGQSVGVVHWRDYTGIPHTGCPNHIDGLRHRYPERLPPSVPSHGVLGLSTPWARGAFGPADRIEVENLIPEGWTIGVSAYRGNFGRYVIWLNDPQGISRARWEDRRDAVASARELALLGAKLAGDQPEPEWLDPIDQAKREADRIGA